MYRITLIIIGLLISLAANAIRESRPTAVDSRIRVITFSPDDVFKFTGFYGYQASIEFGKDENVQSISMGDSTSWQIVPSGNKIFIKPIENDATTNMTLITDKRTYFFELYAREALDIRDPEMVFNVRFIYPDEENSDSLMQFASSHSGPDLDHPEKYNFNYTISGSEQIAPVKIFDDGEFTYMQFRNRNAKMPSFFAVDEDLHESIVNYRMSEDGKTVIIEQVLPKLSLRAGKSITCVFNESFYTH